MMLQMKTKQNIVQLGQIIPDHSYILDRSYRILIIGGSGSGKTNALLNLIIHKLNLDKI